MKHENSLLAATAVFLIVMIGVGCSSLSNLTETANTTANSNTTSSSSTSNSTSANTTSTSSPKVEKADFTMTSEELDKEFTRKGVKDSELEKYANKTIAVSGRVTLLVKEKKGTTQPWVTLAAPGLGHGVSCYFDDDNVRQMDMLKDDAMVKVQGYQDSFIVPEISPMLKHCVVLEGAK